MMDWGGFGGFGGMGVIWFFAMAAFWVLILVGVVLVIKALVGGGHHTSTHSHVSPVGQQAAPPAPAVPASQSDALRILQERYARGELDRDEFLQRKGDLTS